MAMNYRTTHKRKRSGRDVCTPRYQYWIPTALQPLFNGKTTRSKLLTGTPENEAAEKIRASTVRDDSLFRYLRNLTDAQRAEIIARGGWDALEARAGKLRDVVASHLPAAKLLAPLPRGTSYVLAGGDAIGTPGVPPVGTIWTADQLQLLALRTHQDQQAEVAELEHVKVLALISEPAPEYSWDALINLWRDVENCKTWRAHVKAVKQLKSHLGNVDYRLVTREKALSFRDHLTQLVPVSVQRATLNAVKGMYKAAAKKGTVSLDQLPFERVAVLGRYEETPREAFTPAQARAILVASLPGRRPVEARWALTVMAHTGMRPGEVTALQRGDLVEIEGKRAILVREQCAVTGRKHAEKSVKTGEARNVPVVPELDAFYDWASGGDPGEFVFKAFPFNALNKRVQPIGEALRPVMKRLGIKAPPGKKLDGYSFRHLFSGMGTHRNLNAKHMEYVTGHSPNVHDKYWGRGSGFVHLWETVAQVKPLED